MKNIRKMLAVLLVLAMALSLAACGSFETKMARAAKKMEKLQSYRMDMKLDMGFIMSLLGQSMNLDMDVQGKADVLTDPVRMKMDMNLSVMGEEAQMLSYLEKDGDRFVTYVSPDGGDTWAQKSVDAGEMQEFSALDNFGILFKLASTFEKGETVTVRGSEATVYSGTVQGEDIKALVSSTGVLDSLQEQLEVDLEEAALQLNDLGSMPVSIAIDNKSGMITRYTMDLTELMRKLMPLVMDQAMAAVAEEAGLEGLDLSVLGLTLDVDRVNLEAELYDFDAVETFEIPDEARQAPDLDELAA